MEPPDPSGAFVCQACGLGPQQGWAKLQSRLCSKWKKGGSTGYRKNPSLQPSFWSSSFYIPFSLLMSVVIHRGAKEVILLGLVKDAKWAPGLPLQRGVPGDRVRTWAQVPAGLRVLCLQGPLACPARPSQPDCFCKWLVDWGFLGSGCQPSLYPLQTQQNLLASSWMGVCEFNQIQCSVGWFLCKPNNHIHNF